MLLGGLRQDLLRGVIEGVTLKCVPLAWWGVLVCLGSPLNMAFFSCGLSLMLGMLLEIYRHKFLVDFRFSLADLETAFRSVYG